MKGSIGYTRIKITNCANNFLCSGKANALKHWANIGLRCLFRLNVRHFHSVIREKTRKEAVIHAPTRKQKTVKRDRQPNHFDHQDVILRAICQRKLRAIGQCG